MPTTLPPKENALFKRILKCYEHKQYKNGLKFAKQILSNPKFSEHGETLAMKGLTLNCLGRKEEAYEFVRRGLRNDLKSHVCWHVYGLLQRSDKKYDEAIKCYRNALKWDKENIQILRDLSLLQIQMRDLEGYRETRYQLLKLRPGQRASWIGYAISYHLLKDHEMAFTILEEFRKTQNISSPKFDIEHGELLLYQNMVLREAGRPDKALDHLMEYEPLMHDKLVVREIKGSLFLEMNHFKEAEKVFRELLRRNPENRSYYQELEKSLQLENLDDRYNLYMQYAESYPRAQAPKRMPLTFTKGETFARLIDNYMRPAIHKGVPPLFNNIRNLYTEKDKVKIVENIALGYLDNLNTFGTLTGKGGDLEPPTAILWVYHFLAQHFDYLRDSKKAMEYIDKALEHTPTLIEAYMVKARIYKHGGDMEKAAHCMDEARSLDTADRYVNCKCAKYQLRANQVQKAEDTCGLFTREGVGAAENLNEMQCMWFQTESGYALQRLGKLGEALKKAHEIERHFDEITEDQFDFHTYCMRKMTLRAYVRLLRLEDILRSHRFYFKAAKMAIECYVRLHDKPLAASDEDAEAGSSELSAKDLKKLRSKQRRAEKKAQENKKATSDVKETKDSEKKADPLKEPPLESDALVRVSDPLEQALKFLRPLQNLASNRIETHLLAYEVFIRKCKLLLMLQSVKRAHAINPNHPKLHENLVRLAVKVSESKELKRPVSTVIERELKTLLDGKDLKQFNSDFLEQNSQSLLHRLSGSKMLCLLDASKVDDALALVTDLSDTLEDRTLENCTLIYNTLLEGTFGECSDLTKEYFLKCRTLFPLATVFAKDDGAVNGLEGNQTSGTEPLCDGVA
ncbi:N-alpha-acetyltransferase 15, NatA auxiliary subunit-like isoform X1 [Orbicella faveolata]|uniref:N-alpha-acetyltransferase 15, NatA auxiliary subunit-like isoform X1 n=1 Tax=Orbicella faveolata TaxID=48498 RepID=UPI0009E53392|nr:N-alpha-acetyltransferase 15, NatA auxiliary subunit-like isoform X1 [Orbicella faveolata]